MVVDNLVQTMVLLTSCATGTTFVTVYTPWTCKFIFCSNEERIFGKILNYQITLANRLSRALRGGQENPALENFILDETMKCLADLRRMWSQWNFVCRCKKNGFLWSFLILFVTPSECSSLIILWKNFMNIYSLQTQSYADFIFFLCQLKMFCLMITKTLKRCRNSSSVTVA